MSKNTENNKEQRLDFFNALFSKAEPIKTTQGTSRTWRVTVKNENDEQDLFVYMMDHAEFWYNVDNTRIIASKEKWEAENSTVLDPVINKKEIEDFLRNNPFYGDKPTEELKEDIKKPHYLRDPILISEDGVVWNGNRRLAIIRWLLEHEYEQRFEKVPVCRLPNLDDDELKTLEGRLQVKKTFKESYGTLEIRLRIRQAKERDDWSWEKIRDEFGGNWKVSELMVMLEEIKLVDKFLNRIGKPKDYAYIYNKGGGAKSKGGIEIFRTASMNERNFRAELMPTDGHSQQNPEEYNKRLTAWFQQIHLPNVSHDTIREFNSIMTNEQSRKEFFEGDDTYQNFDEYTTTMITSTNGSQIEKTFSVDVLKKENENRIATAPSAAAASHDPKTFAKRALKSLRDIDLTLIPKNNAGFKKTIEEIKTTINKITSSENYNPA